MLDEAIYINLITVEAPAKLLFDFEGVRPSGREAIIMAFAVSNMQLPINIRSAPERSNMRWRTSLAISGAVSFIGAHKPPIINDFTRSSLAAVQIRLAKRV